MTTRDPRTDPRPGDVLRVGPQITVLKSGLLKVAWQSSDSPGIQRCSRSVWRSWAKTAMIINRSEGMVPANGTATPDKPMRDATPKGAAEQDKGGDGNG